MQRHEVTSTRLQQSPEEELRIRTKPTSGIKGAGRCALRKKIEKRNGRNNGEILTVFFISEV